MQKHLFPLNKLWSKLVPAVGISLVGLGFSLTSSANSVVQVALNGFTKGQTVTVQNIDNFPIQDVKDDAKFTLQVFKKSALSTIYADSRLSSQNNRPVFKAFDQDPTAPNQKRLTYLNVQQALDTMLYGDDPVRKKVHLASVKKQPKNAQVNGYGTKVAVIDSGVNKRQPDFAQNIQVHDLGGQKYAQHETHGTEVALTAAGKNEKYQGVAPGAKVHAYAIDPESVVLEDVFTTVYRDKVSVANASFTLGDDTSMLPSIRNTFYKIFKNSDAPLYVFAAGNKDEPTSTFSPLLRKLIEDPKIMENTIVVSGVKIKNPKAPVSPQNIAFDPDAISCKDVKYNCLTAFFAYDVPNPKATRKHDTYVTTYGTSFSAPQVSGAAALVKQMFPWFTANNIRQALLTTATDISAQGIDDKTGWGLVNVGAAVYGPAQFAFGDFVADLTNDTVSNEREAFYFRNNIYGQYGLVVKDESDAQRTLFLTGKNTYKGDTTVKSGILRLEGSLTSQTNIDHDGLFQLGANAEAGSIYNNGFFISNGGTIKGNWTNSKYAISTVTLSDVTKIKGTAKFNGVLVLEIPSSFKPQPGKAYLVLEAGKIEGEFTNLLISSDNPYKASLYYDKASGKVAVKFE